MSYLSLFTFFMLALVTSENFVQLFFGWEGVGLVSYLLIGFWYDRPSANAAAIKAFVMNRIGDFGFALGIFAVFSIFGTLHFDEVFRDAPNQAGGTMNFLGWQVPALTVTCILLFVGAMGKSAQIGLHTWLPDAMEGPTPVSALIHAATMVTAGVYLLARTIWLFQLTPGVMEIIAWNGAFTALLAAVLACVQTDIKRVLAYSTVSQLGYMMAAMGAGFATAGFLHLLTHGIFKALLFLAAGAVIHAVGTNDIFAMGGLWRKMPQTTIVFIVGTLSLAGIPFFGGFFSKEEILGGVLAGGLPTPFAMLLLGAFLTAFYMFRVVFITFFGGPAPASHSDAHDGAPHVHDAPPFMGLPLWILAVLAVGIGIFVPYVSWQAEFEAPGWLTYAAIAVAVAGIALAYLVYQRRAISADALATVFAPIRAAALRRFWIDDIFAGIYRRLMLPVSALVGWIDRYFVDGILNVLSAWTLSAGAAFRRIQSGRAQDYVYGIALGVLLLMVWIRWPR
jgi:NADH-quinone oxidoreductase subunit L